MSRNFSLLLGLVLFFIPLALSPSLSLDLNGPSLDISELNFAIPRPGAFPAPTMASSSKTIPWYNGIPRAGSDRIRLALDIVSP